MGHSGVLKKPNNTAAELLGELQEYSSLSEHVQDQRAGGQQQLLCLCFIKKHREIQKLLVMETWGEVARARRAVKHLLDCRPSSWCYLHGLGHPSGPRLLLTSLFTLPCPLSACRTSMRKVRIVKIGWQQLRRRCLSFSPSACCSLRHFPREEGRTS